MLRLAIHLLKKHLYIFIFFSHTDTLTEGILRQREPLYKVVWTTDSLSIKKRKYQSKSSVKDMK